MEALAENQGISSELRDKDHRKHVPENTETIVRVYCRLKPDTFRPIGSRL